MAYKDPGFQQLFIRWRTACQAPMKAHHSLQVGAQLCIIQHHPTPEAIADGCDISGISLRKFTDLFYRRIQPAFRQQGVFVERPRKFHCFLWIRSILTVPEEVDSHCKITKGCQLPGAHFCIVVQPPPFMNNQDHRPFPLETLIVGHKSF